MALIGVIEPGTVARVLRSVQHARGDVLILFEGEGQSGHVLFEEGRVVMARLDELRDDEAVAALEAWSFGHYSLLKRTRKETEARGHVLLNGLSLPTRRGLDRWLKRNRWATSILGYPQHARQVIAYIQPEVVLMHCPRKVLGTTCRELREQLKADLTVPPLLVVVAGEDCTEPAEDCVRIDGSVESLEALTRSSWPGTRLGVRQSSQERTARIYRPEALPPGTGAVKALSEPAPLEPGDLTARDLLPMLMALLLGSALIWSVWWVVNV